MMKKMLRQIAVGLGVSVAMFAMAACETPLAEPTGIYEGKPGLPPNVSSLYGEPDPTYTGRRFDINNLPTPAAWNRLGHQHAFPDLFHFAGGNKVVTKEDWEARRREISKIIQYYEYGVMPPLKEEEGVHISWVDSAGGGTSTITITYDGTGRNWSITISTTLPASADETNKYDPETGTGGYPLYFGSSGANWGGGTANFPLSGTWASESNGSGNVPDLFGLDYTDPSAPSANISYAWGMSVILTVIEEGGFGGWYNPAKVGITGYSRNGKAAECIGAFAESRKGHRVGHVSIGSAGSGGPALERFISPAGYFINGKPADPLPLDSEGLMHFDGLIGKPWYLKTIANGDPIPGSSLSYAATPGGTSDNYRMTVVRAWSPYFETYERTRTTNGAAGTVAPNLVTPFVGWQSPAEAWSGIQSLSEGRNETPGWFSVRFREFADLHYGLDIDHVRGQEGRGKYGILCTIPFDQHYLSALIPPNGVIFQDGYIVPRNNPESQFANWVILDEIYKFLGEQEGDPEKYIWRNAIQIIWGTHGGNTGNEGPDRNYHAMKIFDGEADTTHAMADPNLMKLRTPPFAIDDPIGRFDYYRMNWGRPDHPSIADRVRVRVDPIMADYEAGEALRPAPSVGADAVHPAYTPAGPKFKAMDWRGLIDTPEQL